MAYGYSGEKGAIKTPNLAAMANEGLTFQTFYASFHGMVTGAREWLGLAHAIICSLLTVAS